MAFELSLYQLPPFIATVLSAGLVISLWHRREEPLVLTFIIFAIGLLEWSFVYTLQLGFTTLPEKLQIYPFIYIGAVIVPTSWLLLTAQYSGRDHWITRRSLAILAIEPLLTLTLVATNGYHGLIYQHVSLNTSAPLPLLSFDLGLAYWINLAYSYILVFYGLALLADVLIRGMKLYRRQATLLIAGALVPLAANSLFATNQSPIPDIDLTTFAFAVTGAIYAVSLFKLDLLSRTPIARRRMNDAFGDGFIVIDDTHHIVNYNDTATRIIGDTLQTDRSVLTLFDVETLDELSHTEYTAELDGQPNHYHIRCLPLDGRDDDSVGYLVALREITDRKAYEQRLEVANRLLRHNLRNDVNLILGHANNLERTVDDTALDDVTTIKDTAHRLEDLSQKANQIETTLQSDTSNRTTVDTVSLVRSTVEEIQATHSGVSITVDAPSTAMALTPSADLLEAAIGNLLENAIEHTDRDPTISVTIDATDTVAISVADNGPGIPEIERAVLEEGEETQLEHGSGLGLWLVHWITTAAGGTISFEDNEPRGTIVTLTLPRPGESPH